MQTLLNYTLSIGQKQS